METAKDAENLKTKREKVPRPVKFVLVNRFLERFSGKGISGILLLFLNRELNFDKNISTSIYHIHEFLGCLIPVFGAIIADSYVGNYETITWTSLMFAAGSLIVSVGAVKALNIPTFIILSGFFIAVFGSGCMKSNLNSFGATQYKLPEQTEQLKLYFSLQVLFMKIGNLFGQFSGPLLRGSVTCFGSDDCYPLAFSVPALAMFIAFLMFFFGKSFFIRNPPSGNMVVKVVKCVWNAVTEKIRRQKTDPKNHWLDYAEEKYGVKLVAETKIVMNILKLYMPLPFYWAVSMLQGSRWVFQATRMNCDLGFYTIQPDQVIILNPLFIIITLPLCDFVLYPILKKFNLKTTLQKMTIGGFIGVFGISISVFIEFIIQSNFISVLWLIPQYFIFAISDNFIFVSQLSFSYTEASSNMKSVMMSSIYVIMACGNLIVVLVSGMKIFTSQANELVFFTGILATAVISFGFLAIKYKPAEQERKLEPTDGNLDEKITLMETENKQ